VSKTIEMKIFFKKFKGLLIFVDFVNKSNKKTQ